MQPLNVNFNTKAILTKQAKCVVSSLLSILKYCRHPPITSVSIRQDKMPWAEQSHKQYVLHKIQAQ